MDRKLKQTLEERAARRKILYSKRKQEGLCTKCGGKADEGTILCTECKSKAKYVKGKCRNGCGENARKGMWFCQNCANRKVELLEKRSQKGLCRKGCAAPAVPGSRICQNCRTYQRKHRQARSNKRFAEGLCRDCGDTLTRPVCKTPVCPRCRAANIPDLGEMEKQKVVDAFKIFDEKCQCCGTEVPGGNGDFHIDHCHREKRFRGIICYGCNIVLGKMEDDPVKILKLYKYVTER